MPTNTSKFNLVKPLKSEKYNVDVFNGNADIIDSQIYSKTEVDTALNGKANSVHTHPISEVVNLQTTLNGKVDKLMATNLVTNGDFSNGATGWSGVDTSSSIVDSRLYNNGSNASIKQVFQAIQATPTSNRFYVRYSYELISGSVGVGTKGQSVSNDVTTVGVGIFSKITSGGIEANNNLVINFAISSQCFVDNILAINLTALFGAGNEPTRLEMDKLLSVYPNSWFNGTSEIGSIGALMRATLGVQVVTPTLLNSRTGTAQYAVSNDGLVIFRGTASGGSLNTNIFVLPENIRPSVTRVFPISANSAFGVVTVASNGEVRQTVGALTNVFLDGIVFKVGVL